MKTAPSQSTVRRLALSWLELTWYPPLVRRRRSTAAARLAPLAGPSELEAMPVVRTARRATVLRARRLRSVPRRSANLLSELFGASGRRSGAFTLIELLTVIAIIAILAALLLPALAAVKDKAKAAKARSEMAGLETAITQYEAEYNRMPASKAAEQAANPDYTYGSGVGAPEPGFNPLNAELIIILMDLDQDPNKNHQRNPRRHVFLTAKEVSGPEPGVSTTDRVFRDPWGTPYVITMDMNDDNKCLDAFYRQSAMRGDLRGLTPSSAYAGQFELNRPVMIWSLGKDRRADRNTPCTQGVNKDNVLLWQ